MSKRMYVSREVAVAAGLPYATLMRWLFTGILIRRQPSSRTGRGSAMLWTERDLQEARIAAALRDYISRAEGPLVEIMRAVQALETLPAEPALHLDAAGRPEIVEYDAETDDLRLFAPTEVRRAWIARRPPGQRWLDQDEIDVLNPQQEKSSIMAREEEGTLDLFA